MLKYSTIFECVYKLKVVLIVFLSHISKYCENFFRINYTLFVTKTLSEFIFVSLSPIKLYF